MSDADLTKITQRVFTLNPELRSVLLYRCNMDTSSCVALMKALWTCKQLNVLDISGNTIGGTSQALDPHLVYPELKVLDAAYTSLSGEDIQRLADILKNNGMPKLNELALGYNKLEQIPDEEERTDGWEESCSGWLLRV